MSLERFYVDLLERGDVALSSASEPDLAEIQALKRVLIALDSRTRLDVPGRAPELSIGAASWAAVSFYRAAQLTLFGDAGRATTAGLPCPDELDPGCAYSVDLTLRFLPDLMALARGSGARDGIADLLESLALDWPLSSVGARSFRADAFGPIDEGRLAPILADGCLRRIYADRVIAREDAARLDARAVRVEIEAAAGGFPELLPASIRNALARGRPAPLNRNMRRA